jgi:polyhydroxybutyrate depolymerase
MRPGRLVLPALALVAAAGGLTACSSSAKTASTVTTTTVASAPATSPPTAASSTTRPACHPKAGYAPGTDVHHLEIAGVQREFLVHLPPHPTAAMRLIVDFHGANSNMREQAIYSGFDAIADRDGFVVATPNGIDAAVRQWRFLGTKDDVNFAVAIVQSLVRDACVDASHAYATGISSGGAMTASVACQASTTFAGFAPVAADFYLPPICDQAKRRPIIIFHGTADPVVPYGGGHVGTSAGLPVGAAEATAAAWAHHNGCKPGPVQTRVSSQVTRLRWNGCVQPVVMYRIEGGGHTWPGAAIDVPLGLTTKQISASTQMWKFFTANT